MNQNTCLGTAAAALLLLVAGCCCGDRTPAPACAVVEAGVAAESVEGTDVEIALDQLPAEIKAAALAAVPGLVIGKVERETENGRVVYDVEGTANGRQVEIEVTADGKVLEIEEKAGGEHEDDDDDDRDDP